MTDRPTGTVAFLFTDIEGSTQLWEARPQAMAMALRRHDDLVRAAVAAHHGHVFSTGGDGFGVAFPTVADAVGAAVDVQRSLHRQADDFEAGFRVRMGLHAGDAIERDGDYFGPVVNRAARIMTAAHGGQILVSALAVGLLDPAELDIELRDLGTHRLKDLLAPEPIVQVTGTGLPRDFPPLRSRRAGNIAGSAPTAVGRDRELHEIIEALSAGRLVTVVSAVPRSAAAICFGVARSVGERFPYGTWHLDLAPLASSSPGPGAALASAFAAVLGIDVAGPDAVGEVAAALEGEPVLLVLESGTVHGGSDHDLADAVTELLDRLPSLSILVTSPTPLGVAGERAVEIPRRSLPPDLQRFRATPIVEREAELTRLRGEVSAAAHGARRLVMISGEEGIGKSRLVAEVAAEVVADDGLVLRGAWDEEGVTDFQAFREAFARHLDAGEQAGLGAVDRGAANDADRYRLFDALDRWLAERASVQPVLLWLDDLQWADPSSLQMIQHLARSPRPAALVIVTTYERSGPNRTDDFAHALAQLRRSPGFDPIELAGLSTRAARTLIERAGRTSLGPRSSMLLHEWSGGNPYFLQELIRLVDESAPLEATGHPRSVADLEQLGAPESISDVVAWRLARRSPQLAEALTVASVIGTVFDAATLAAVLDIAVDEVEDILDVAVESGFIDEDPGTEAPFAFRQDLIRQALYQAMRPRQRARLHARVLDVLVQDPDPDPAAVARHLSVAAGPDDLDRTVEFATAAARRATDQMAFENAARHYDQALRVLDRHPEVDGPRIELLIAAGAAHNRAGALGSGREHLRVAAAEAQRRDRPDLLARAALAWGGVLPSAPPPDPEAVALLRAVVERYPGDAAERARALVRQAEWLHRDTTYAERRTLVDEAVAIAERLDDPATLGWVLNSSVLAMLGPDDAARVPAMAEQIIALSGEAKDDELAFSGWKLLLQGLFANGQMDETRDVASAVRRLGENLRQPEYLRIAVMWDANVASLEGRFDDARRLGNDALTITLTGDHSQVGDIQLILRLPAYGLRGTSPALRARLDEVGGHGVRAFRAWFHAEAGELDQAAALLAEPDLVDDIAERRWYLFWGEVVGFTTAAARLGDVAHARRLRDLITPYRATNATLGLAAFLGAAAHHRGVLSGVLGEWDEAVADLDAALERHLAMGARPWAALSQVELARVLQARAGPGDADRSAALVTDAVAVAEELGLGAVLARVGQPITG